MASNTETRIAEVLLHVQSGQALSGMGPGHSNAGTAASTPRTAKASGVCMALHHIAATHTCVNVYLCMAAWGCMPLILPPLGAAVQGMASNSVR